MSNYRRVKIEGAWYFVWSLFQDQRGHSPPYPTKHFMPIENSKEWQDWYGEPDGCECRFLQIVIMRKWCCNKPTKEIVRKPACCIESSEGVLRKKKRYFSKIRYDFSCYCDSYPDGTRIAPDEIGRQRFY